jgi:16S rRNA pseudouridine516 synthase
MRIDRFLVQLKYGSRSQIKEMIERGRITCRQMRVSDPGCLIDPDNDSVEVDGIPVFYRKWIYLMVNKPQGILSARRDDRHPTVIGLLREPYSRFDLDPCGRLDLDTEGLMILTNDGEYLHQVISPKKDVLKQYEVRLARPLGDYSLLEQNIWLKDGKDRLYLAKPAKIVPTGPDQCRISIGEGKYHEVKRMFEAIGNEVVYLKRIAIGGLTLDSDLPLGAYKELTFSEAQAVFR